MGLYSKNKEDIEQDKSIIALKLLLDNVKEKYNLESEEIINLIYKKDEEFKKEDKSLYNNYIPLLIFHNDKLSALEIIVRYLKENLNKSYHEIALLLNRNDRTIWTTYNNSLKKYNKKIFFDRNFDNKNIKKENTLFSKLDSINIPLIIFSIRDKSVLETLVCYLKDQLNISFKEISLLLIKDYQTIYTSYRKGKNRIKKNKKEINSKETKKESRRWKK